MFGEQGKDRRQSYSFKQHFQRAMATKGLRRLLAPMVGTAIVASVAFAYCGADGITGPSGGSSKTPTAPISANTSGGSGLGGVEVTTFPVTEEEIPSEIGPFDVPTNMQGTTCNGDVVNWEEARTKGSGVMYFNPKTLATRVVLKFQQHAKGPGTQWMRDPTFPKRFYNGWEAYERESFFAVGATEIEEEYDVHIIARDERETRMVQDDYMLRLKVRMYLRNGVLTVDPSSKEKCF